MDYECEKGAKRNFEPWREAKLAEETEEERLDRLEREEGEKDAMADLESKALDAKTEMEIADSLDRIRTRNARLERANRPEVASETVIEEVEDLRRKQDEEDAAAAAAAFQAATGEKVRRLREDDDSKGAEHREEATSADKVMPAMGNMQLETTPISFVKAARKKKDFAAALGIKKKPSLL